MHHVLDAPFHENRGTINENEGTSYKNEGTSYKNRATICKNRGTINENEGTIYKNEDTSYKDGECLILAVMAPHKILRDFCPIRVEKVFKVEFLLNLVAMI